MYGLSAVDPSVMVSDTPVDWRMQDFVYTFDNGEMVRSSTDLRGETITADDRAASWFEGNKHLVLAGLGLILIFGVLRR